MSRPLLANGKQCRGHRRRRHRVRLHRHILPSGRAERSPSWTSADAARAGKQASRLALLADEVPHLEQPGRGCFAVSSPAPPCASSARTARRPVSNAPASMSVVTRSRHRIRHPCRTCSARHRLRRAGGGSGFLPSSSPERDRAPTSRRRPIDYRTSVRQRICRRRRPQGSVTRRLGDT